VCVSDLQVDELLAGKFRLYRRRGVFDRGTVTDTVEAENGTMSFADTEDVVLEVCAGGAWIG
jgi:hypothetical protein